MTGQSLAFRSPTSFRKTIDGIPNEFPSPQFDCDFQFEDVTAINASGDVAVGSLLLPPNEEMCDELKETAVKWIGTAAPVFLDDDINGRGESDSRALAVSPNGEMAVGNIVSGGLGNSGPREFAAVWMKWALCNC